MSTRSQIELRIREVAADIEGGWSRNEIIKRFTEKWGVSPHTIERYLYFADDIITNRLKKREDMLDIMRAEHLAVGMEKLRSTTELEARLCAIAESETDVEKTISTKEGMVTVKQKPDFNHILRAIDRVLKMRGCYVSERTGGGKDKNGNLNPGMPTIIVENEEAREIVESITRLP